jgi:predicted deacylase
VVITSGNHGPEGYAGGALQALFMEEILSKLPLDSTGILLVHALNPWGFKHHRRGTENNVNLNRNFDITRDLFSTRNEGYEQLATMLEPRGRVRSSLAFPASRLLVEMAVKKDVTQQTLTEAIGKGQYRHATGINYGGQDFEPQTVAIIPILERVTAPYSSILNLDLHTGLGKKNVLHLMTKREMNAKSRAAFNKLVDPVRDRGQYEVTPPEAEGFYEIHGDYANILGKLHPDEKRIIIPLTAEFGTVGNGLPGKITTINRLILENQGHLNGYANARTQSAVERRYLELFYPQTGAWKESTLQKGRYLLDVIVRRFISQN